MKLNLSCGSMLAGPNEQQVATTLDLLARHYFVQKDVK
jgi:hypothetical protein